MNKEFKISHILNKILITFLIATLIIFSFYFILKTHEDINFTASTNLSNTEEYINSIENSNNDTLQAYSYEILENAALNFADGINFTVEFYKQNLENNLYTKAESLTLNGNAGDNTNLSNTKYENKYPHFNLKNIENTTILQDGSSVVKIYYDRMLYDLDISLTAGGDVVSNSTCTAEGMYKYGTSINVAVLVYEGFEIEKWKKNGNQILDNNSNIHKNTFLEPFILEESTLIEVFFTPKINEIIFDINNSFNADVSGEMNSIFAASKSSIKIPKNNYTLIGYKFLGWSSTRTGYPEYKEGDDFIVGTNSRIGLFAIWQEKIDVVFDVSDFDDKSFTYNGKNQNITGNIITNNTDNNKDITITNNEFKNVPNEGYLEIIIKSLESDNFKYGEALLQIPINKIIVEIEFLPPLLLVEGNYSTINAKALNVLNGDEVNCILENNINKDAGNYTAKVVGLDNDNYALPTNGISYKYSIGYKNVKDKNSLCILESLEGIPFNTELNIGLISSERKFFAGDRNKVLIKTYTLIATEKGKNANLTGDYRISIINDFIIPENVNFYVYVMENNKYVQKDVLVENGYIIFNASNIDKVYIARDMLKEESNETLWIILSSCAFAFILFEIFVLLLQKNKEKKGKGKTFKFYSFALMPLLLSINIELTAIVIFVIECGIILLLAGLILLNIYENKKAIRLEENKKAEELLLAKREKKKNKKK